MDCFTSHTILFSFFFFFFFFFCCCVVSVVFFFSHPLHSLNQQQLRLQGGSKQLFNRFVEIGRVCLITRGPDEGKLCVIVDVIDGGRALVDGPSSINGVSRQPIGFGDIRLTDIVIKIPRAARLPTLLKAYKAADVEGKWNKTSAARKLAVRKARANLSDFDRFKVRVAKKTRAMIVAGAAAKK